MKKLMGAALVGTLMLTSQAADAGGYFSFSYIEPAPVYVAPPRPVYYYPAPRVVYAQPYYYNNVRYYPPRQCPGKHSHHHHEREDRDERWEERGYYYEH